MRVEQSDGHRQGCEDTEAEPPGAALRHFSEVNEMVRSTKHRKPFCRGRQIAGK